MKNNIFLYKLQACRKVTLKEMILHAGANTNIIPLYSDTDYLFLYLPQKNKIALIPLKEFLLHKKEVEKNYNQYDATTPSEKFKEIYAAAYKKEELDKQNKPLKLTKTS